MAGQRTTFGKLQRDRAKKAKAAAKREKRQERNSAPDTDELAPEVHDDGGELSAPRLLELIESIHRQFEAKTISYEDFEEKKADLLSRLPVD